jgi:hypothetical protein
MRAAVGHSMLFKARVPVKTCNVCLQEMLSFCCHKNFPLHQAWVKEYTYHVTAAHLSIMTDVIQKPLLFAIARQLLLQRLAIEFQMPPLLLVVAQDLVQLLVQQQVADSAIIFMNVKIVPKMVVAFMNI